MKVKAKNKKTNNLKYIFNSHTEPLFNKFKLLKKEDMLKLQELTFNFKYIHKCIHTHSKYLCIYI